MFSLAFALAQGVLEGTFYKPLCGGFSALAVVK